MPTRASTVKATGFAVLLLAVIVGVSSGGLGLLLCFVGVVAGASLIAVGVRMADDLTTPIGDAVFSRVGALMAFMRRNLGVVGLVMASSAVAAVAGDTGPVLCFSSSFVLFLLGVCMITIGVLGG
ncbi:hypothetical protein EJB05_53598, partial [Eragrostis curvula]